MLPPCGCKRPCAPIGATIAVVKSTAANSALPTDRHRHTERRRHHRLGEKLEDVNYEPKALELIEFAYNTKQNSMRSPLTVEIAAEQVI